MKKICVLPFMHTLILPNGDINLCCNSELKGKLPNVSDTGLDNILNNPLHKQIRKEMLQGKEPDICRRCWDNEKIGIKSYRQQQNVTYPHYLLRVLSTDKQGEIEKAVKYFDVRFNNVCNLKCVMCSSAFSTSWIEDEKKLKTIVDDSLLTNEFSHRIKNYDKDSFKWSRNEEVVKNIIENAESLERIHFAGGEPLLAKEHQLLLDELIKLGVSRKIFLSYNTNAEFIDQQLLDTWSNFKRVKILYSMDHIEDKNEYIRYPSKWSTHLKNFDLIERSNPSNVEWRIAATLSLLNVAYVPEFVEWKISSNFKHIHNFWLDGKLMHDNILEYPKYLNMNILSDSHKEMIKLKFKNFKTPRSYKHSYEKIKNNILSYLFNESNTEYLPTTKKYLEAIDQIRNTDFRKTFPFLSDI